MADGLWTVPPWGRPAAAPQGLDNAARCPHCPQPRRRGGPVFDDQMALFSIIKVQTRRPKWPSFR